MLFSVYCFDSASGCQAQVFQKKSRHVQYMYMYMYRVCVNDGRQARRMALTFNGAAFLLGLLFTATPCAAAAAAAGDDSSQPCSVLLLSPSTAEHHLEVGAEL